MLTMLLSGLWHGASWNFVVWGGWHGALLSAEYALGVRPGRHGFPRLAPIRMLITFVLVLMGWAIFRARTLGEAAFVLRQLVFKGGGHSLCPRWLLFAGAFSLLMAVLEERYGWFERVTAGPAWVYSITAAFLLFVIELLAVAESTVPFVYFQF